MGGQPPTIGVPTNHSANIPSGKMVNYMCHGFVSAGDALGREHPATPMSSFLTGRSGCKWPNTSLLLGRAPLGGTYGRQSLLRSTPTLEGGQRTGACITKWMGG